MEIIKIQQITFCVRFGTPLVTIPGTYKVYSIVVACISRSNGCTVSHNFFERNDVHKELCQTRLVDSGL